MGPEVANRNRNSNFHGPYAGRDMYIIMLEDKEREFVVTHNTNIRPVSYFTGRETELEDLRRRMEEKRKSVLVSGMGGIGKTHICRKLFEEYWSKHANGEEGPFRYIGYVEYSRDMGSSLQNCLKYKQQEQQEANPEAAWRELEYLASDGKLLLFVDNVDRRMREDPGLQRLNAIPGAVILTSRQNSFSDEFEPYRIGFLSPEQCREIYEKIRFENSGGKVKPEEVQDLEYIIDELAGRHTITVEFLAHLALVKRWSVKRLKEELEQKGFRLEFRKNGELVNIQKTYEGLYDLSELTEAEQNILEAFSIFPYIPLSAEIGNQWLLSDAGASEEDDILTGLYQKGWLQFDLMQESYAMHPVFAQFIYDKCRPAAEKHLGLIAACGDCIRIPDSGSALECQRFIPFAENITKKIDLGNGMEQAYFLSVFAHLLLYMAEYKKSAALYEKSVKMCEDIEGENNLNTANSYGNLAEVYRCQGEYGKAEKLHRKALGIYERVLGENHPITAVSYNCLAMLHHSQAEYGKAEELYQKSLGIRERVLEEDHPDIAQSYNNLAALYYSQAEYGKAEELYQKSLRISERVFGENHPNTATSYNNLATVYCRQGEYGKAEELYQKSLGVSKGEFGENHPETAMSYHNLALVYYDQGEYGKAEELYQKSLTICKRALGENHPDTAASYNCLAMVYCRQEEYGKAEELHQKSLAIRKRVLGENHPDTATSYNSLAIVYDRQGKYGKAEELYQKSLVIYERELGENHPYTAANYSNLALLYCNRGEYENAIIYCLKAYKIISKKQGLSHPYTQIVYNNMKKTYCEQNPDGNFEQWLESELKENE